MKQQVLMSLILAGSLVATAAQAEEQENQNANTSTVKVSDVQNKEEQKGDIDDEITNAKMRAESGSKSTWSMQFDMTYEGGNLETPFSDIRPNYAGEAATPSATNISGTIEAAVRLDKRNRVSFGTGVEILTPFQTTSEDATKMQEDGGNTDISNPYVNYSHSRKIGDIQNSFSLGYTHYTNSYYTDVINRTGAITTGHTAIFSIEGSNWQPGLSTALYYYLHSDGAQDFDSVGVRGARPDWQVGFYPFVEYSFNDMLSFRTVFRPFTFSHMRSDDSSTLVRSLYTQSVGLGIAATRDIYLYPNMQFAPENLQPSLTNVGLSMTANIF